MLFNNYFFGIVGTSKKVFLFPCSAKYFSSRYVMMHNAHKSALFLSGNEATSTYAVLSPYLQHFNQRLNDENLLNKNIQLRGLDIDLPYLQKLWSRLKKVEYQKATIETKRKELAALIKSVKKFKDQAQLQELQAQGKEIKQELKITTHELRSLEEEVIPALLHLPNDLHRQTLATDKNLFQIWSKPTFPFKAHSHVAIGKITNQLEIIDCSPNSYYLKNDLAVLELAVGNFFSSFLVSHGYSRQSNPDFSKSVVVDGCGFEFSNSDKIFTLDAHESDVDQSCLHLTGGSSLPSFASYFTKQVIEDSSNLPVKQFTIGRNYTPNSNKKIDLFNCSQSTSVDAFIVFKNKPEIEDHMIQQVLMVLTQSYTQLKMHFRIVRYRAQNLKKHESGAIGIEMYSPVMDKYYEVGRVSLCGSFISERLWCLHNQQTQHQGNGASFLSMIHVRVCQIAPWLALLMENTQQANITYGVPKVLKPFMHNVKCKYV